MATMVGSTIASMIASESTRMDFSAAPIGPCGSRMFIAPSSMRRRRAGRLDFLQRQGQWHHQQGKHRATPEHVDVGQQHGLPCDGLPNPADRLALSCNEGRALTDEELRHPVKGVLVVD